MTATKPNALETLLADKLKELDERINDIQRPILAEMFGELNEIKLAQQIKIALVALEFYANEKDNNWFAADLEGDSNNYESVRPIGTRAREALAEILRD